MTTDTVPQTVLFPGSVRQATVRQVQPGAGKLRRRGGPAQGGRARVVPEYPSRHRRDPGPEPVDLLQRLLYLGGRRVLPDGGGVSAEPFPDQSGRVRQRPGALLGPYLGRTARPSSNPISSVSPLDANSAGSRKPCRSISVGIRHAFCQGIPRSKATAIRNANGFPRMSFRVFSSSSSQSLLPRVWPYSLSRSTTALGSIDDARSHRSTLRRCSTTRWTNGSRLRAEQIGAPRCAEQILDAYATRFPVMPSRCRDRAHVREEVVREPDGESPRSTGCAP